MPTNIAISEQEVVERPRTMSGFAGRFSIASTTGTTPYVSEEQEEIDNDEDIRPAPLWRIMKYNKPEWLLMLVGSISTLIVGGSMPLIAIVFGELYGVRSTR